MKRVLILVLTLSVFSTSFVWAQGDKDDDAIHYSTSIGIGSAFPNNPDEFNNDWKPSFGLMLDIAAARSFVEVSANFDYSFFLSDSPEPNDVNVLTTFLNLKIKPLNTTARPYVFVGGGYYRFWIVDLDLYENVLGYGGGAGVEVKLDESRLIFIEGKLVQGRTRIGKADPELPNLHKANTEIVAIRTGITFSF